MCMHVDRLYVPAVEDHFPTPSCGSAVRRSPMSQVTNAIPDASGATFPAGDSEALHCVLRNRHHRRELQEGVQRAAVAARVQGWGWEGASIMERKHLGVNVGGRRVDGGVW